MRLASPSKNRLSQDYGAGVASGAERPVDPEVPLDVVLLDLKALILLSMR